tara:strand:- start:116 stop:445 length:330 start_codon:yes stop_codon:yes gene_type:complete
MNNFYLKSIIVIIIFGTLSGCQSLKDGLEGNKKSKSAEEFLIEKKNPLVLPPDFSKLPLPKEAAIDEIEKEVTESFDLEKIIKKKPVKKIENTKAKKSLSKSVLEKIKK